MPRLPQVTQLILDSKTGEDLLVAHAVAMLLATISGQREVVIAVMLEVAACIADNTITEDTMNSVLAKTKALAEALS